MTLNAKGRLEMVLGGHALADRLNDDEMIFYQGVDAAALFPACFPTPA
jgi:hypothetical protein